VPETIAPPLIAEFALDVRVHVALTGLTAVGLLAWLARRRLPPGMGLGLLVAAVSGATLVLATAGATEAALYARLGYALTGLALAWYAISRRRAQQPDPNATGAACHANRQRVDTASRLVLTWAAAVCFLAAAAVSGIVIAPLTDRLATQRAAIAVALLTVAIVSLLLALATIIVHWSQRRRTWLTEPQRLTDLPPRHPLLLSGTVGAGVIVAVGGVLWPTAGVVPLALLVAALAVLTVGHRGRSGPIGKLGLLLVGLAITTAGSAWIMHGWDGALLGCALAGVYFRWLAGFWDQQLLEGRPWTTAGRLIPAARRLAELAATACAGFALAAYLAPDSMGGAVWRPCVSLLICLLLARGLLSDSDAPDNRSAAAGAVLAFLAATVPARQIINQLVETDVELIMLLATAGFLVTLRTALRPVQPPFRAVLNAGVGGALPAAALLAPVFLGINAQTLTAASLGVAAALVTLGGRSGLSAARPHL